MTNNSLENRTQKTTNSLRRLISDTMASTTFALGALGLATARDLALYGLTLEQSLISRGVMATAVATSGGPFGFLRDYLRSKANVKGENLTVKGALADIAANSTFYTFPYALTLYCTDTGAEQIGLACGVSVATSTIMGPLYGMFMDKMRKVFE